MLHLATENFAECATVFREALEIYQEIGYRSGTAEALNSIGILLRHTADPQTALDHHMQARQIADEIHSPLEEARALEGIGKSLLAIGQKAAGVTKLDQALAMYERIGAAEASPLRTNIQQSRIMP